jgi:hypothetical protein
MIRLYILILDSIHRIDKIRKFFLISRMEMRKTNALKAHKFAFRRRGYKVVLRRC